MSSPLIMISERKRPSDTPISASESSDTPDRKRLRLVDGVEAFPLYSDQVPHLTEGKETLSDGQNMAIHEDLPLRVDLEVIVNGLGYIYTPSSVSQTKDSPKKHFKKKRAQKPQVLPQSPAPQPANGDFKATGVSSGLKRNRINGQTGDSCWSDRDEEEEERLKRRTGDVERASSILSRYQLGKKLGEGGFGAVYEGRHLADGRKVAIKIAEKEANWESIRIPGFPSSVPLEVGLLILVSKDPKISEVIELLEWEDLPDQYIVVMERPSPSEDLEDFIKRHGGVLSEKLARVIIEQAIYTAYMCCERGVFHRDIKPENLLVNPKTLELKLIDFGCGARMRKCTYNEFCGTLKFFPPEFDTDGQYLAKPATVWSLGLTLFRMVCGRLPDTHELQELSLGKWFKHGLSTECCQLMCSLLQSDPKCRMKLDKILLHSWFE